VWWSNSLLASTITSPVDMSMTSNAKTRPPDRLAVHFPNLMDLGFRISFISEGRDLPCTCPTNRVAALVEIGVRELQPQ